MDDITRALEGIVIAGFISRFCRVVVVMAMRMMMVGMAVMGTAMRMCNLYPVMMKAR
ncbi:MAG: hypothetical protein AAGK14_11465 [Verrucomicrobiota bacterium]